MIKLKNSLLEIYLILDTQAKERGFENYLDLKEFETNDKKELEEIKEIQKQIDKEKKKRGLLI